MLGDISGVENIFIVCGYTDMRKAIPTGKKNDLSEPAVQGVHYCDQLFAVERYCREHRHTAEQRHAYRNKKAPAILKVFWEWLDKQHPTNRPLLPEDHCLGPRPNPGCQVCSGSNQPGQTPPEDRPTVGTSQ